MSITESDSNHHDLEKKEIPELLQGINEEDKKVALAVEEALPSIEKFLIQLVPRMEKGGRLFYIGSGTSGRLGILDASECPPTFGVDHNVVVGLISGGDIAIRKSVEHAEDDPEQAWKDLAQYDISKIDTLVGIAASGRTPYVIGGIKEARKNGILTACITCNLNTELAANVDYPIEVVVGPEFVTGSTRMKAGTAQKMVLNMISTVAMIGLGRVKGNKMVDMQLSNNKLVSRGVRMIMSELNIEESQAAELLKKYGSVRASINSFK
jgi:N-acetylmuramic acid 6-phosphate etherase